MKVIRVINRIILINMFIGHSFIGLFALVEISIVTRILFTKERIGCLKFAFSSGQCQHRVSTLTIFFQGVQTSFNHNDIIMYYKEWKLKNAVSTFFSSHFIRHFLLSIFLYCFS